MAWLIDTWLRRRDQPSAVYFASKAADAAKFARHAEAAGRGHQLLHLGADAGVGFDPCDLLCRFPWATPLLVERLVSQAVGVHDDGQKGGGDSLFFDRYGATTRLHLITLLMAAYGTVKLRWLKQAIDGLPRGPRDKRFRDGFLDRAIRQAIRNVDGFELAFRHDIVDAREFVMREFLHMPSRQREGVRSSAGAGIAMLVAYPLGQVLEREGFDPEVFETGGILAVDLPPLVGGHPYRMLNCLIRSTLETILIVRPAGSRDVISVVDEYPIHFQPDDPKRMATCRESGLHCVRVCQTVEVGQVSIGGNLSEQQMLAVIENCPLKIAHSLPVGRTAQMVESWFGDTLEAVPTCTSDPNYDLFDDLTGTRRPTGGGVHFVHRPKFPAYRVSQLKRGGPPGFVTECVAALSGTPPVVLTLPQILV